MQGLNDVPSLLSDPTVTFNEIVSNPIITRLIRLDRIPVCDYFIHHSHDLLINALSDTKSIAEVNSYQIIIKGNPDILTNIMTDDEFLNRALDIVNDNNVARDLPFLLGRLSTIALVALAVVPQVASQSCGFIYHLLQYCDNPSVFDFFESIITDDEKYNYTHKWLYDLGFVDYLFRELGKIDFGFIVKDENPYFVPMFEKASCLYQLISKCAKNHILFPSLIRKDLIDALSMTFRYPPTFVENARWDAITSLVTRKTAKLMNPIVPSAILIITKPYEKLPAYLISALEIVTRIMIYDQSIFDFVVESKILQNLLNLVIQFSNSTILLDSFRNFVAIGLTNHDYSVQLVVLLLPFIIDFASTRENRVLTPYCFNILQLFIEAAKSNRSVKRILNEEKSVKTFIKTQFTEYKKIIENDYGTDMTIVPAMFRAFLV